jgi:hypothetical protein
MARQNLDQRFEPGPAAGLGAIPEVGALAEWRKELREGSRTRLTVDALWLAAVHEAQARDYLRDGMIGATNEERKKAAAIILEASSPGVAA